MCDDWGQPWTSSTTGPSSGPFLLEVSTATLSHIMKTEIHPEYVESQVKCTCGNQFTTRSTESKINVEVCSNCHPFYTGRQKLMDTGGRVERFQRRAARRARGDS